MGGVDVKYLRVFQPPIVRQMRKHCMGGGRTAISGDGRGFENSLCLRCNLEIAAKVGIVVSERGLSFGRGRVKVA